MKAALQAAGCSGMNEFMSQSGVWSGWVRGLENAMPGTVQGCTPAAAASSPLRGSSCRSRRMVDRPFRRGRPCLGMLHWEGSVRLVGLSLRCHRLTRSARRVWWPVSASSRLPRCIRRCNLTSSSCWALGSKREAPRLGQSRDLGSAQPERAGTAWACPRASRRPCRGSQHPHPLLHGAPASPAVAGYSAHVQVVVSERVDSRAQPLVPVLVHGVSDMHDVITLQRHGAGVQVAGDVQVQADVEGVP